MSSDWDADYGLSQGPIDSNKNLNIDLNAGLYAQEPSEYDFEPEDEENLEFKEMDDREKKEKSQTDTIRKLKKMLSELESRLSSLEKDLKR
jgi:hypothetical protein